MIWDRIKNIIKKKLNKPNKEEWFGKLVKNLETQILEDSNLPFKIIELKKTGFAVKVSGLYAFAPFDNMPWKYSKTSNWASIAPKLIDKVFFCKIHSMQKDPLLIIVNGEIPQFKKTELRIGEQYRGIIIGKIKGGILIEIGYHFNWRCGSFIGFLHKSQFDPEELFSICSVGDEINVFYQGLNEKGQLVYTQIGEIFDWNNEIPQGLVGQIVLVHVVREGKKGTKFLVEGKYTGKFFLVKKGTQHKIQNLKNGEIIRCKVEHFSTKKRTLYLQLITELDSEIIETEDNINKKENKKETNIRGHCIENSLDNSTIQKMIQIRDEIEAKEERS